MHPVRVGFGLTIFFVGLGSGFEMTLSRNFGYKPTHTKLKAPMKVFLNEYLERIHMVSEISRLLQINIHRFKYVCDKSVYTAMQKSLIFNNVTIYIFLDKYACNKQTLNS